MSGTSKAPPGRLDYDILKPSENHLKESTEEGEASETTLLNNNNDNQNGDDSNNSTDVNPYAYITQTDQAGNPVSNQSNDLPPPVPEESPIRANSCIACFVKYLCCINYEDFYNEYYGQPLLGMQHPSRVGKHTLVLDLDETLVHSSFQKIPEADFSIQVTLEGKLFEIYVVKRPGVDEFLKALAPHFELVIFTASVPKYACKVLEELDKDKVIDGQLYREHCTLYEGNFVKDLARLGRNLKKTIIIDNSPLCFQFQPENAIGVSTFMTDKRDRELFYCKDFLLELVEADDVRDKLKNYEDYITQRLRQDFPAESIADLSDTETLSPNSRASRHYNALNGTMKTNRSSKSTITNRSIKTTKTLKTTKHKKENNSPKHEKEHEHELIFGEAEPEEETRLKDNVDQSPSL